MQQIFKEKAIKISLLAFILFAAGTTNAQVGIGIANPNASAQLDVSSTTRGFLPPRMTQAQRMAIKSPAPGLIIWCTDCGLKGELSVYNGNEWAKTTGREGKNYYVSSLGNDNNDGLSPLTPWETINKVNSQMRSMSPGDSILFERDSYFFGNINIGRSGTAQNPIVFGAYGTGKNKPVFIEAVTIWSLNSPIADLHPIWKNLGNNIWSYKDDIMNANKIDVANLVLRVKNATRDTFGIKVMSATPLLTSQGQFWYDFDNQQIKIFSAEDPRVFYSSIQTVQNVNAIEFQKNAYLIFENLAFRYYGKCVVEACGNYCSFRNLDISFIGGGDHSDPYSVKDRYKERYGNGLQIWNDDNNLSSHDITITGCRIDNIYDAGISPQGLPSKPCSIYNIFIRNNVITNCEFSFEFFERHPNLSNTNSNIYTHDIYFEYNTCVNAGKGWAHNQRWANLGSTSQANPFGTHVRLERFDGIQSNIFIRNNIFYGATETLYWIIDPGSVGNIVSDYNDFYQTQVPVKERVGELNWYAGKYSYTLTDWQSKTSKELHSINADPLFTTDYHLKPGSPVIGKGIDAGYGTDMGAYPF